MNIIPLIGGAIFAALGAYIIYDYQRFNKNAIKAKGRILRYDEYFSKGAGNYKRKMFRPIFELTVKGKRYEVKSKTSFHSKIIPVGQNTDLLYQQGDEENARLAKGNDYGLGLLFIALSIPAFYFGLFR
ncbi:DUF3592 domain-containing protein [uncultured Paraglaciecola sp.]|uniref:DUF3592 domain-containing protein n=1 Tax=uncultured Paraglaciecola sp. TaxID=1765024 RepID=UPI0030D9C57C|tara:strand:- start:16503 stop:16889 length:387 start_codon:yes stop_codon:yes gene_type:complete